MEFEPVLTRNIALADSHRLEVYKSRGGYATAERMVREVPPQQIVQMVKDSGLRGRGGAGFPCGLKWSFLPKDHPGPFYLVVNADESEPGTFKDRLLLERDPHQLIEGIIISAYATGVRHAYVYLRGEFYRPYRLLQQAVDEAYAAGLLGEKIFGTNFGLDITLHRGAGAYVCGEETGLLESLEGKRGWPRLKPPFPAVVGAFGKPTIINNVETICCVVHIAERGPQWFKSIGTSSSTGPKLFGISGHVNRPGVVELPLGVPCRELIEKHAGGVRDGRKVKAVIPGGVSMGVLTAEELDCPMDFDGPRQKGCLGLGTACITVMDETTDMVKVLRNIVRFFAHESCGQCTPCREGTGWALQILNRIVAGRGRREDLRILLELAESMGAMPGTTICGLADGAAWAIKNYINKFPDEFEAAIRPTAVAATATAAAGRK